MSEKVAPDNRHSFLHNGLSLVSCLYISVFFFMAFVIWKNSLLCIIVKKISRWKGIWMGSDLVRGKVLHRFTPPNVHSKQFYCKIQSEHVEVGIKGKATLLISMLVFFILFCLSFCWILSFFFYFNFKHDLLCRWRRIHLFGH